MLWRMSCWPRYYIVITMLYHLYPPVEMERTTDGKLPVVSPLTVADPDGALRVGVHHRRRRNHRERRPADVRPRARRHDQPTAVDRRCLRAGVRRAVDGRRQHRGSL